MKKKILFVVSSPGLSSYSSGVLKAVYQSIAVDCHVLIFIDPNENKTEESLLKEYNVPASGSVKVKFIYYHKSKILKHLNQGAYNDAIIRIASEFGIKKIHFISQDTILSNNIYKYKKNDIYYTVHDLKHHDSKVNLLTKLKTYYLKIRKDKYIVKRVKNLVTSSLHQYEELIKLYPNKSIFYHDMPSLITPQIICGTSKVKELDGETNYILFFGRIELYKGVEFLYDLLIKNEIPNLKLVIAGYGHIYFSRQIENEQKIIFINRFIHDEEMNDLFSKAHSIVLPYISATQSAVTSLAYHYNKPVVLSDLDGLKDNVVDGVTGLLFQAKNSNDLRDKMNQLIENQNLYKQIQKNQLSLAPGIYDLERLKAQIESIYY